MATSASSALRCFKNNQRTTLWLAYGLALLALLYWLFQSPDVIGWRSGDQKNYIATAQDFYINHRFLVAYMSHHIYLAKPPVMYWWTTPFYWLFGVNYIALKIAMITLALANLLMIGYCERMLRQSLRSSLPLSPLLLMSNPFWLHFCLQFRYENILMACILLAFVGLLLWQQSRKARGLLLWALGIGLGNLTKGPVVFLYCLPLCIIPYVFSTVEDFSRRDFLLLALATVIGILLPLAWLLGLAIYYQPSVLEYFTHHMTVTTLPGDHSALLYFHPEVFLNVLMHFLFWSLFLIVSCYRQWSPNIRQQVFVIAITILPALLFFMFLLNIQAVRFQLPAYPILSLALAIGLQSYWEYPRTINRWLSIVAFIVMSFFVAIMFAPISLKNLHVDPFSFVSWVFFAMIIGCTVTVLRRPTFKSSWFLLFANVNLLLSVVVH